MLVIWNKFSFIQVREVEVFFGQLNLALHTNVFFNCAGGRLGKVFNFQLIMKQGVVRR